MDCAEVDELLGAFALHALTAEEDAAVRAHLDACELHEEASELRRAAGALASAAAPRPAPPRLRQRLIETIAEGTQPHRASARPSQGPLGVASRAVRDRGGVRACGGRPRDSQPLRALRRWQRHALVTVTSGAYEAQLIVLPDEGISIFTVTGLDPTPSAQVYQVWRVGTDGQRPAPGSCPNRPTGRHDQAAARGRVRRADRSDARARRGQRAAHHRATPRRRLLTSTFSSE